MGTSLIVVNPYTRKSSASIINRVQARLVADGPVQVITTKPGQTTNLVARHLHSQIERVYVLGGDGTVGDVAGALNATDIPIGIIPCGTTNVLARECRIPMRPLQAAETLIHSKQIRVFRTWSTGSGTLVLALGVGFDAKLMWHTPVSAKKRWGLIAVLVTAFRELISYDFPQIEIEGENSTGDQFKMQGTFLLVSNTQRYTGELIMIPAADPSDDLLDIVVFSGHRRKSLIAFWGLSGLPGRHHLRVAGVSTVQAKRMRINALKDVEVHLNGDPHGYTPVRLEPSGRVLMIVPE